MIVRKNFFNQEAEMVAKQLLGKVLRVKHETVWLSAQIIETEAYYIHEKASHSSLGRTPSREALFMPAGTIYMYYCRGGDTLNIRVKGEGNAVLIKSGFPYLKDHDAKETLHIMQENNLLNGSHRPIERLCNGQTLLCKSLGLKVKEWNKKTFDAGKFYIDDTGITPKEIIATTRLGIPKGRDEHLPYRFIDKAFLKYCTKPRI